MNWNERIHETLLKIFHLLQEGFGERKQSQEASSPEAEVWLNPNELRIALQISESTYRRRVRSGILVGEMRGGNLYFKKSEVMKGNNLKWKKGEG